MLHETIFNLTLLRQQHVTRDDFYRNIERAINNNVSISANNMADDESNQQRKVKFLQILLLMDSFEEEDVWRSRERLFHTPTSSSDV